jgi:hypothetical protein
MNKPIESVFRDQITLAGLAVVGATYFMTGSVKTAAVVGIAHGVAHYVAGKNTIYK